MRRVSTATTRCSGPNVLPVTWFWWRQHCTDACRSVAVSRPTSASSAARLTSSSTCIVGARAGASVTSACLTPPSTEPSRATRTSRATWKSHILALKVHARLRHQMRLPNGYDRLGRNFSVLIIGTSKPRSNQPTDFINANLSLEKKLTALSRIHCWQILSDILRLILEVLTPNTSPAPWAILL